MKIRQIIDTPLKSLQYLECHVNKGSPSGFDAKACIPMEYLKPFQLSLIKIPTSQITVYGESSLYPALFGKTIDEETALFPLHPVEYEILVKETDAQQQLLPSIKETWNACPSSSMRTVFVEIKGRMWMLKLHYSARIGRFKRVLNRSKLLSSIMISKELDENIQSMPAEFAYLPEPCGMLFKTSHQKEMGAIIRDIVPAPIQEARPLIPFFSLFSTDEPAENDRPLLLQLRDNNPQVVEWIVKNVLICYKALLDKFGVLPECNAQNLLLEINASGRPARIVFRDLQSFTKDLYARQRAGRGIQDKVVEYKGIRCDTSENRLEYHQKHSFLYDFKLGEYIFEEIGQLIARSEREMDQYRNMVKYLARQVLGDFLDWMFDSNKYWYAQRPGSVQWDNFYEKRANPKYR